MAIDTTGGVWRAADRRTSTRTDLLEFFEANPGRAYSLTEIARTVVGVAPDIEGAAATAAAADDPDDRAAALTRAVEMGALRAVLEGHLSALAYAGEITVRDVPNSRLETDRSEGTTPCYALAQ